MAFLHIGDDMPSEQSKTYPAFLFRQRADSPLQVAFVAPSAEIDAWARVPTKKTSNIRNFQRAEIPNHIKEVQKFFGDTKNASPTAVVVGFDPIRAKARVEVLDHDQEPLGNKTVPPGEPVQGYFKITWAADTDPQVKTELVEAILTCVEDLRSYVYTELGDICGLSNQQIEAVSEKMLELASSGGLPSDLDDDDFGDDENDDGESSDESEELQEHAVGLVPPDLLELVPGLSPSEVQLVVGRLQFLRNLDRNSLEELPETSLSEIYTEVFNEIKPGILIDGQHRVMGTKKLGTIPFLVTALPQAAWPELAFQFIVTNRTAKRVPESLLISIVGNSLSKKQRGEIETRLRDANIRVGLIEAVMKVHEDEQSPFYGALAFGLKNEKGFLEAAAVRGKVIQLWYERRQPVRDLFDHMCEGRRISDKTEYWKAEELWFSTFIAFWSAVKARYAGSGVFSFELRDAGKKTPMSRLMTATVLQIFQETVLRNVLDYAKQKERKEKEPISKLIPNDDRFSELITSALESLTPEFFEGWQLSGFDGSRQAKEDLTDAIRLVLSDKKSVGQLKDARKPHSLFRKR